MSEFLVGWMIFFKGRKFIAGPAVNDVTGFHSAQGFSGDIMNMNNIGKFEMRNMLNTFDAALIRLYGRNMLDAAITRYEALDACNEFDCPSKAAEVFGQRRGLDLLSAEPG